MYPDPLEGMSLIRKIISLAFKLEFLIVECVPILKSNKNQIIHLTQHQIGSLLANAFLVLFPDDRRYAGGVGTNRGFNKNKYTKFLPTINFDTLYTDNIDYKENRKIEKLKCLLNYFHRITSLIFPSSSQPGSPVSTVISFSTPFPQPPPVMLPVLRDPNACAGVVTFKRRSIPQLRAPMWSKSVKPIQPVFMCSEGLIEDSGDTLQIDFAHKFVGGAILDHGMVQEEIRFVINPELIVSHLFTEKLMDNEVLFVIGTERYNRYTGYGNHFRWDGDFEDTIPRNQFCRRMTHIVAMDAMSFVNSAREYSPFYTKRELMKAYCAFAKDNDDNDNNSNDKTIATGNWGCGVYGGDKRFKIIIQILAASEAERHLKYFTFGDIHFKNEIESFLIKLIQIDPDINVGKVFNLLIQYGKEEVHFPISNLQLRPIFEKFVFSDLSLHMDEKTSWE
ncbi:poly(ADP-ribose) glycohydrolase-like [Brevipalpus obovatus]|uniref:poly(ADP-ribose) glycohydrolase-like n=1 Tax=Brevipalpus obovatus TaxID=246614 RepID=UPI003D9E4734